MDKSQNPVVINEEHANEKMSGFYITPDFVISKFIFEVFFKLVIFVKNGYRCCNCINNDTYELSMTMSLVILHITLIHLSFLHKLKVVLLASIYIFKFR